MYKLYLTLWLLLFAGILSANKSYCFRIYLSDKGETTYSPLSPEKFLSAECIERRLLREIFVDESDLPISGTYLDQIRQTGVSVITKSKWMRTVVIESRDSSVAAILESFPFVDSVKCVWYGNDRLNTRPCPDENTWFSNVSKKNDSLYHGYANRQTAFINGKKVHELGYRGKGVRIAVIDAGFMHVDRIEAFSSLNLIGTYNAVNQLREVFCEDDHGTKVLSCMAANIPGIMVGTAPEASYLLIKSEDTRSEMPIEEDFWAAAVEYADSTGIDIISSSLGYFKYDGMENYYSPEQVDGKTAFISRIAQIAAEKGILVVCSAGNEGNSSWEKITFPADAQAVLTVGSVTGEGERSSFSSIGMTADYRIKPDVAALGTDVAVIGSSGDVQSVNGTSFSAPTIAGMCACLLQAFPLLKNSDIIALVKQSASQNDKPDAQLGYGIPDIFKAYTKANQDDLQKY